MSTPRIKLIATLITTTALIFPFAQVNGTDYKVATDNKDISCSVTTLSRAKLIEKIGRFAPFEVVTGTANTSGVGHSYSWFGGGFHSHAVSTHTTIKKQIDPFKAIPETVMGVVVTIKNNSLKTIKLTKDEYLRGVAKGFMPKNVVQEKLYPQLLAYHNGEWKTGLIEAIIGGIGTGILGGVALVTLAASFGASNVEQQRARQIRHHHGPFGDQTDIRYTQDSDRSALLGASIMSGLFAIPFGILTGFGIYSCNKAAKVIKQAEEKEKSFKQLTGHYKSRPSAIQAYSEGATYYRLRPNEVLKDIFFLDLSKVDRDFFEYADPRLDYI